MIWKCTLDSYTKLYIFLQMLLLLLLLSHLVVSDSVRPHGLQPTSLLLPWDFPGNSTGVGCHCLLPFLKWEQSKLGRKLSTTTSNLPCFLNAYVTSFKLLHLMLNFYILLYPIIRIFPNSFTFLCSSISRIKKKCVPFNLYIIYPLPEKISSNVHEFIKLYKIS